MNDCSTSESLELDEFCPICQVPFKNFKIVFSFHISMCDVRWNELEECINGINCQSESIFHYRDFSHQVLATHRENLRKRKRETDAASRTNIKHQKIEKENVKECSMTVVCKEEPVDEDDEEIFIREPRRTPKRIRNLKKSKNMSNKTRKGHRKTACVNEKNLSPSKSPTLSSCTVVDVSPPLHLKASPENDKADRKSVTTSNGSTTVEDSYITSELSMKSDDEIFSRSTSPLSEDGDPNREVKVEEKCEEHSEKKEKCKALWKNIFKNREGNIEETPVKRNSLFSVSTDQKKKVCPYFKKMPGTGFAVDAFQFGSIPGITTYFLTHFHSDHYIGLKKAFSHPIYCSLITANLVKKKLRVSEKYLHVLELNQPTVLNRVEVTCFDANHCPGAIMILFRLINGEQYLHVGDFRACTSMEQEVELRQSHITRLYLDTTYFDPQYVFPLQKDVIDRVRKIVREMSAKHQKALFVAGSYLIGKEKVFLGILEELQCKLWAQPQKRDVFRCINDERILSALTNDSTKAKVHVLPMNHLRFDRLKKHLLDQNGAFSHLFAFKPTGWEMGRSTKADWINVTNSKNMTIYGVPYSEHSNFEELCRFIRFIKADKIIPTVPMRNREMYNLLKSITDSYQISKQQSIQRYMIK